MQSKDCDCCRQLFLPSDLISFGPCFVCEECIEVEEEDRKKKDAQALLDATYWKKI